LTEYDCKKKKIDKNIVYKHCFLQFNTAQLVYQLATGWPGDQILVGARCFAPALTSPKVHPASYTMGTGVLPEGKGLGDGVETSPPPHSALRLQKE